MCKTARLKPDTDKCTVGQAVYKSGAGGRAADIQPARQHQAILVEGGRRTAEVSKDIRTGIGKQRDANRRVRRPGLQHPIKIHVMF